MRDPAGRREVTASPVTEPSAASSARGGHGAEPQPERKPRVIVRRGHLPLSYHLVWGTTLVLLAIGLVMIFSTSSIAALFQGKDALLYLRQQGMVAAIGLAFLFGLSRVDYRKWRRFIPLGLALSLLLLVAVLVPGIGRATKGAQRWIDLGGPLSLQPSEIAKFVLVAVAASLLAAPRALTRRTSHMLYPLGPLALAVCCLVMLQKDLGTTLLTAGIVMGLLWVAGMRGWHWGLVGLLGSGVGVLYIAFEPFRRDRLLAFLHPFVGPPGPRYQLVQSLLAFGSGGLFGVGPGRSVQKFSYLPEARTDMIFAILGEEFGLIGVTFVLTLFVLFVVAGWRIAMRCRDPFGKYLATGCTMLVGGQAAVNTGGVLAAIPLTGVPLPFISYGKTNLLVMLISVGVLLSIARFGPTEPEDDPALSEESTNVAYLDRRGRDRGPRGAGAGAR